MADIRGYSTIAERSDPTVLAEQLNEHRRAMNRAIMGDEGTVMQYVGDAVMAVFGAPIPQPSTPTSPAWATPMHRPRARSTGAGPRWACPGFGLGIGMSTGDVVAALLGSDERVEYTVVGDAVNLTQRLQDLARHQPGRRWGRHLRWPISPSAAGRSPAGPAVKGRRHWSAPSASSPSPPPTDPATRPARSSNRRRPERHPTVVPGDDEPATSEVLP